MPHLRDSRLEVGLLRIVAWEFVSLRNQFND